MTGVVHTGLTPVSVTIVLQHNSSCMHTACGGRTQYQRQTVGHVLCGHACVCASTIKVAMRCPSSQQLSQLYYTQHCMTLTAAVSCRDNWQVLELLLLAPALSTNRVIGALRGVG